MKKAEDERARERLRAYFFGDDGWNTLSERARRALVEADRVWFSTRVGRPETVLNELRIATDEVVYSLLWVPLCHWIDHRGITDPQLLDFQKIRQGLDDKRHRPSLGQFQKMLRTQALKEFLNMLALSTEERRFILKDLPRSLGALRSQRKSGEHDIGIVRNMKDVAPLFKEFMGIGCEGVLPRLVKIQAASSGPKP